MIISSEIRGNSCENRKKLLQNINRIKEIENIHTYTHKHIHTYKYIYLCVDICILHVCMCVISHNRFSILMTLKFFYTFLCDVL